MAITFACGCLIGGNFAGKATLARALKVCAPCFPRASLVGAAGALYFARVATVSVVQVRIVEAALQGPSVAPSVIVNTQPFAVLEVVAGVGAEARSSLYARVY